MSYIKIPLAYTYFQGVAGMTPGRLFRLKPIDGLIVSALILALLFTGCVSAPSTQLPTFLPRDRKDSMRTIGVVSGGVPELAMQAYKKEAEAEAASTTLHGAGEGIGAGLDIIVDSGLGSAGPEAGVVFLFTLPLGILVGAISAAAMAVPERRAKEIEAAVLPALSDFPFQERMVELIAAAGNSNTEYDLLELPSGDTPVDAVLEVSVLGVGLHKLEKALQIVTVVRAQLLEKDTGTPIVLQNLQHGWRAFGKKKPERGDVPLSREEIDGYLSVLSEDIVDMLLLMDDFSARFPALWGYEDLGLLPKYPKPKWSFFGKKFKAVTVDSLQPRLEWVPFPSPRNTAQDAEGRLNEIGPVLYDLRIWRIGAEEYQPVELVYERRGLADPWHAVEQPLEPGTSYYWAVRARFGHGGRTTVTRWTISFTGFFPLKDSLLTMRAGLYRFSTPQ